MGQKVHPNGLRVGVIREWNTRWYASKKDFADFLVEDNKLRKYIKDKYKEAGVANITIERTMEEVAVTIDTARPGILIGEGGAGVEQIRTDIESMLSRPSTKVKVNIREIANPDTNAQLIAESIASQIEKRASYRRAMKQAMGRAMKAGAKGIKLQCAGRLGGAEIARAEGYHDGSIPLQTIRANIEYGFAEAHTTYGRIGVKIWIYKGEVLGRNLVAGTEISYRDRKDKKSGGRRPRKEGGK